MKKDTMKVIFIFSIIFLAVILFSMQMCAFIYENKVNVMITSPTDKSKINNTTLMLVE